MGLFVWSWSLMISNWLFCTQNQIVSSHLWCMFGGTVWMEWRATCSGCCGPLGTSWPAKMSLMLNELISNVLCSNLHTNSENAPKTYRTWKVLHAKQPTPNQLSLKDNSATIHDIGNLAITTQRTIVTSLSSRHAIGAWLTIFLWCWFGVCSCMYIGDWNNGCLSVWFLQPQ